MNNSKPRRFLDSFYNPISLLGAAMAVIAFGVILLLVLMDLFAGVHQPYVGILTYIILPVFLVLGLLVIPVGMWRTHYLRSKGIESGRLPVFNLNNPQHRRSSVFFLGATSILALFTALGTYRAYEFTDSNTFCGEVCHTVMQPEYTTYQVSAHARVKCADCHVGSGAEWLVKAKISGTRQLFAVLFNTYARPISTPIENLRPARETCEQCHWPAKFYGRKQSDRIHFMADERNTRWRYNLLQNIGGMALSGEQTSGIHWHIGRTVEYVATDHKKMEIPWVRVTYDDGTTRVFKTEDSEVDPAELGSNELRTMDCMDCHNRPSHVYKSAPLAVNTAMSAGLIDPALPSIKARAVEALESAESDTTTALALETIAESIRSYYSDEHPELAGEEAVLKTITAIQNIFKSNYFPAMKANWRAYPNHIGHLVAPGCWRCHDGKHVAEDDEKQFISHDCNLCHQIIKQDNDLAFAEQNLNGLEFKHPEDIGKEWLETGCYECHAAQ